MYRLLFCILKKCRYCNVETCLLVNIYFINASFNRCEELSIIIKVVVHQSQGRCLLIQKYFFQLQYHVEINLWYYVLHITLCLSFYSTNITWGSTWFYRPISPVLKTKFSPLAACRGHTDSLTVATWVGRWPGLHQVRIMQPPYEVLVKVWATNWGKSALGCHHCWLWEAKLLSGIVLRPRYCG